MSDSTEQSGWSKFLPKSWLPDGPLKLSITSIALLVLHTLFGFVPYISEEGLGWHHPWSDVGVYAGSVGLILPLMLIPAIAAAAAHRKLCYVVKDKTYLLTAAFCGLLLSAFFAKIAKGAVDNTVGGAEVWYASWGLAAVYILKPGMDHILDIAQPKL